MIGERVRLAREACRLTQDELVEAAGLSQSTLSDLEAGRITVPAAETIERIAKATVYPVGFFYKGALPDLPEGNHRKLKRGTSKVTKQVRAQVRQVVEIVCRAEEVLRLPQVSIEPITDEIGDLEEIEDLAASARKVLGIGSREPIPNVTRSVERAGVVVITLPSDMEDHDGFSAWPDCGLDGRPIIAISRGRPGDRDRFTISHELAHLLLHTLRRGVEPARAEKEASRFAGAFLLPKEAAREALRPPVTLRVLMAVKATFGTSIAMGAQRALDLRLIDHDHFVSLRKQLSARKWNHNEPVEVPSENPLLIAKVLRMIAGDGPVTAQAEQVGMPVFAYRALSGV